MVLGAGPASPVSGCPGEERSAPRLATGSPAPAAPVRRAGRRAGGSGAASGRAAPQARAAGGGSGALRRRAHTRPLPPSQGRRPPPRPEGSGGPSAGPRSPARRGRGQRDSDGREPRGPRLPREAGPRDGRGQRGRRLVALPGRGAVAGGRGEGRTSWMVGAAGSRAPDRARPACGLGRGASLRGAWVPPRSRKGVRPPPSASPRPRRGSGRVGGARIWTVVRAVCGRSGLRRRGEGGPCRPGCPTEQKPPAGSGELRHRGVAGLLAHCWPGEGARWGRAQAGGTFLDRSPPGEGAWGWRTATWHRRTCLSGGRPRGRGRFTAENEGLGLPRSARPLLCRVGGPWALAFSAGGGWTGDVFVSPIWASLAGELGCSRVTCSSILHMEFATFPQQQDL